MAMYFQQAKWHTHQNDWFQVISCMQRETTATQNERFHSQVCERQNAYTKFPAFHMSPTHIKQRLGGPQSWVWTFWGKEKSLCTCPTHSLVTIQTRL